MEFRSKLPNTGTTIFTTMSARAASAKAINLGQGFPDFPMDEGLIARVNEAMLAGANQYAPMEGLISLRETIAEKAESLYGCVVKPATEITVTPGGTYGLYTAMTTLLQPGDEVIVFEPAYDSYVPGVLLTGAVPVTIPLDFPSYGIPWEKVKAAVNEKTKLIILNSPSNPTGTVLGQEDITALRDLVRDTNIFILSDEVYEHIIFDNVPHLSMLRFPDLWERSFVNFSVGKVFHCTGWRIGYVLAPEWMMKEFRKAHQYIAFSVHHPMQAALADYLKDPSRYISLGPLFQEKKEYFETLMKATRFQPLKSFGSYFQIYSYKDMSDMSDADYAGQLVSRHGVATIPVSAFYQAGKDDKVLRFCFAKKKETLESAVEKLLKA